MRLPIRCLSIAACIAGFTAAAIAADAPATPAAAPEQVNNPAYISWSQYAPGTTVSYKMTNQMEMPKDPAATTPPPAMPATTMTITMKLVEVKPEGATVENTMKMTMNGQEQSIPQTTVIPAKVDKGKEGLPPVQPGMTVKNMKSGTENIDVKGKSVAAVTQEFTAEMTSPQQMTMQMKTWTAPGVPGGLVKTETHGTGAMTITSVMDLVDYTVVNK